jgi:cell division protein FtsX
MEIGVEKMLYQRIRLLTDQIEQQREINVYLKQDFDNNLLKVINQTKMDNRI